MQGKDRFEALAATVAPLAAVGVVPAAAPLLTRSRDEVLEALTETVAREVPAYAESGNPEVLPELEDHLRANLAEVSRLLAGGQAANLDFVVAHAEQRASQKFPLYALLQAYRCLLKTLSVWVRDAALEAANTSAQVPQVVARVMDFAIEYTGAIGALATASYVEHTRRLAQAEGDRRSALFNTLLDGYDESDQRAARLLRQSGYLEQRQSYCIAIARSVNPEEMESVARAERMVDAVSESLAGTPVRTITGIRDNLVVTILSATRRLSGWTAPQSSLADRVYPKLRMVGPAALIGLSSDVPSTSHIPRALDEARIALDEATVAERVVRFSSLPFRRLVVSTARDEVRRALPGWVGEFISADRRGRLADTLRAYADCDMNVQKTAKLLAIHPNTIYARMQKIEDLTGSSPLRYHALTDMLLALDCHSAQPRPPLSGS